jgi:tetratricopeptide (TPR) repeat protein
MKAAVGSPGNGPAGRPLPLRSLAVLAVMLVYAVHLGNGFIYDDHLLVLQQRTLRSPADLLETVSRTHYTGLPYYRPLTQLSYSLQKTLFGNNPLPYHAVNTLGAGILFAAVSRFFSLPAFGLTASWSLLAALLFCLHPAVSSCVFPVSGFETVLAGIFMTLTLVFFTGEGGRSRLLAVLFFTLSLLTKEQAVVLPPAMVLMDLLGLGRESPGRKPGAWLRRYLPFLLVALLYLLLRSRHFSGGDYGTWNDEALGSFLMSYAYALQTSFAPFFSLHYEPQAGDWFSPLRLIVAAGALFFLVAGGGRMKRSRGKAPLFFAGLFFVAVLPTSNLITQETPFAERYVFTALLGLVGLASSLVASFPPGGRERLFRAGAVLLLVACAGTSLQRGFSFRDDEIFSSQWIRTSPRHPGAQLLYGNVLIRRGDMESAETHFARAVELNPEHAQTRNSLGVVFAARGKMDEAEREFREAVRIYPLYAEAHFNLGMRLAGGGDLEGAAFEMGEVLRINPSHVDARYRLGQIRARQGRLEEASALWKKVLQLDPGHAGAREELRGYRGRMP